MSAPTFDPVPCSVFRNDDGTLHANVLYGTGTPLLFRRSAEEWVASCGAYVPAVVISDSDYADLLRFRALDALPAQGLENAEQYRQEAELRTHDDLKRQYVAIRILADEFALITIMQNGLLSSETDTQQGDVL